MARQLQLGKFFTVSSEKDDQGSESDSSSESGKPERSNVKGQKVEQHHGKL